MLVVGFVLVATACGELYEFGNDTQPFPEAEAKATLTKATTRA